jgi:hypothetical protein
MGGLKAASERDAVKPLIHHMQQVAWWKAKLHWLFRVPSIATDFFNILNFNFLFPSHTHYMFRPLWAILRWVI